MPKKALKLQKKKRKKKERNRSIQSEIDIKKEDIKPDYSIWNARITNKVLPHFLIF